VLYISDCLEYSLVIQVQYSIPEYMNPGGVSTTLKIQIARVPITLKDLTVTMACCSEELDMRGHLSLLSTGLLDRHPKCCKMPSLAFFSIGKKLIMFIQPISLLNLLP